MTYINVVVDNKSKYTDGFFTYKVTEEALKDSNQGQVSVGDLVAITFGKSTKEKSAIVCQLVDETDCPSDKIKEIIGIQKKAFLTEEMVKTALWMKQRYGVRYYDALKCFIPSGKPPKAGKEKEPYKDIIGKYKEPERLTGQQQIAFDAIADAIESQRQQNFLIHGVTSSGKTQVYMEAIKKTISMGRTAIMLVPEISLTKQVIEVFAGRFGKESIAVLHSKLTPRERYDEWSRIRGGQAKIVIGARMAVFAPLENLGLIVMDEEHEAGYKADMTPKYETVEVALKRLASYKGVLVLGSATPSVNSYYRASQGIYTLLTLKERYNKTPLPEVEIVDMRGELKEGNTSILSRKLYDLIASQLQEKKQVILLQNRRGYSNFISCRECGKVMKCPDCGISLTYHKAGDRLHCHYCGKTFPVPTKCPDCLSKYIKGFGIGTEQVQEAVQKFFNEASVDRLDIDTLKTRKDLDLILDRFAKRETDILVGTQLVAKGHDFENIGLVGVIAADSGLNIPDYRSAERTFQLVTQAAGRAGRGAKQGKVVIQTYEPENYALVSAAAHDYEAFYEQEIQLRQFMSYPPFSDLIMTSFISDEETLARGFRDRCKVYMEKALKEDKDYQILAPKDQAFIKSKDKCRFYLILKCPKGERNKYIYYLDSFNKILVGERADCTMDIDVNPYSAY